MKLCRRSRAVAFTSDASVQPPQICKHPGSAASVSPTICGLAQPDCGCCQRERYTPHADLLPALQHCPAAILLAPARRGAPLPCLPPVFPGTKPFQHAFALAAAQAFPLLQLLPCIFPMQGDHGARRPKASRSTSAFNCLPACVCPSKIVCCQVRFAWSMGQLCAENMLRACSRPQMASSHCPWCLAPQKKKMAC